MKAKHAVARIKGLSVWQKIFCALIAVTLLALMIPNGLSANAEIAADPAGQNPNNGQKSLVQTDNLQKGGVDDEAYVTPGDLMNMNSKIKFSAHSVNNAETFGHFTVQTASMTIQQMIYEFIKYMRAEYDQTGHISKETFKEYLVKINDSLVTSRGGIAGFFSQMTFTSEETGPNYELDMTDALAIPDFIRYMTIDTDVEDYLGYLNTIIPSNAYMPFMAGESNKNWEVFQDDGSIFVANIYLGSSNDIFEILRNARLVITRIVPEIPAYDDHVKHLEAELLANNITANDEQANGNGQAYFINWDIDLYGDGNYLPLSWWQQWVKTVTEDEDATNLLIPDNTVIGAQGNFWDVEGLVPVHLDFSGAYVKNGLCSALYEDGWYTTDFVNHSVWTKPYFEWVPAWYVTSHIWEDFAQYILPDPDSEYDDSPVYKDAMLNEAYAKYNVGVYAGPHLFETDNEDFFGTLGKETTYTFSMYPVSPRGKVVHEGHGDTGWEYLFDVADPVEHAYVMFYNEWGWPLFDFNEVHYGQAYGTDATHDEAVYDLWNNLDYVGYLPEDFVYVFAYEDGGNYYPDYCFDTQIDHAEVIASDFGRGDGDRTIPDIYIPLRVNWDEFDATFAGLFDGGLCDFNVERLMHGYLETLSNDGIESYKVEYFEDGNLIADPFTISDPWEIAWFGLPMVTNGTITTWQNTLVSGFGCYMDFVHPFGDADPMTLFQNQDNFTASNTQHWYQCRLTANAKPGYEFSTWYYDRAPFSADTYAGEPAIYIDEPGLYFYHVIRAGFNQVAGAAIYGDEADNAAIYGDAAGTAIYGAASTPDGSVATVSDGTAQTGDSMGFAFAIIAMIALAAGVTATRKIMVK